MPISNNTDTFAYGDKTPIANTNYTTLKEAGIPYREANFSKALNDYPELRTDMAKSLKNVLTGVEKDYGIVGGFRVSSAYRPNTKGGHTFRTGADLIPQNGLTYTQLSNAIKKYGDGLDGIPHKNITPGTYVDRGLLPKDLDALPQNVRSNYHFDIKYTKPYAPPSKPDTPKAFKDQSNVSTEIPDLSNATSPQQMQLDPRRVHLEHLAGLTTPSVASLGSVIFGAVANIGISALSNFGAGKLLDKIPTGNTVKINSPYYGSPTIEYPAGMPHFHSGATVPGQGEMLAVLKGGETVRTKAQEDELQQNLHNQLIGNTAPTVCGSDREQNQNVSQESKKPIHQQLTKDDEMFFLRLVADAIERNRCGLRNQIKAV